MIVLWVSLLLLHQGRKWCSATAKDFLGFCVQSWFFFWPNNFVSLPNSDSLVPVITVQTDERVTLTCGLPKGDYSNRQIHWYKQSAGDNLKLIALQKSNTIPVYGPEFSNSRFKVQTYKNISSLVILRTTQEDEGMYHCGVEDWTDITWTGMYLSLKGKYVFYSTFEYLHSLKF